MSAATLTRIGLAGAVEFGCRSGCAAMLAVRSGVEMVDVSATSGEGSAGWIERVLEGMRLAPCEAGA